MADPLAKVLHAEKYSKVQHKSHGLHKQKHRCRTFCLIKANTPHLCVTLIYILWLFIPPFLIRGKKVSHHQFMATRIVFHQPGSAAVVRIPKP